MTETTEKICILNRPFYRVIVIVNGEEIDIEIMLTMRGRAYAQRRAHAHHRRMVDDDEAIAEIMNARDNYYLK